ncbi:MAG: DMT family transporter [Deltaproteobacteria bacterium]|jgi:drug/metabolite transporter (DMT)-like permease|nr:DMT family transporter [Deltaproteobacteria bacterium]
MAFNPRNMTKPLAFLKASIDHFLAPSSAIGQPEAKSQEKVIPKLKFHGNRHMKNWQADLLILFGASIWGFSFIFGRWGLADCSPGLFMFMRFALAALVTYVLFAKHIKLTPKKNRNEGLILGMMMGGGYLLQTYSLNFTDVARAAFFTGMCLLGIPILNYILFRDVIKINSLVGLVIVIIGLYIFLDPSFKGINAGDIVGLISIPVWALYMIYLSVYTTGKTGMGATYQYLFWQLVGVLPVGLLTFIVLESGLTPPLHPDLVKGLTLSNKFVIGLIFNAILASVITVLLHTSSQKYTTPIQAMICFQAEPITATIAAVFIFNEKLTAHVVVGGAIIILAILVSELGWKFSAK